jgi:hypothetical protein
MDITYDKIAEEYADRWRLSEAKSAIAIKALELDNLQLRSALTAIRDRIWTDGETYDERIGDLKWLATEALEQVSGA